MVFIGDKAINNSDYVSYYSSLPEHIKAKIFEFNKVNFEDLLETLTLGGFEVENSYELNFNNKKDTIIDINTTPNRSDTLSFKGIANEISSLTNKFSKLSKYGNKICDAENLIINSILKISNLDKKKKNYSIPFSDCKTL